MRRLIPSLMLLMLLAGPARAGSYDDLFTAVQIGDLGQVSSLLRRGIEPDTTDPAGFSLLMVAAVNGQASMADLLLRSGAHLNMKNRQGDTALMLAALKGHLPVVELLVKAGAQLDHSGWTAMHYAAFEGRTEVLNYLIKRGAQLEALSPNDSTPLMLAARNGHREAVEALLAAGADPDPINYDGKNAASWARVTNNSDIAELLTKASKQRKAQRIVVRVDKKPEPVAVIPEPVLPAKPVEVPVPVKPPVVVDQTVTGMDDIPTLTVVVETPPPVQEIGPEEPQDKKGHK